MNSHCKSYVLPTSPVHCTIPGCNSYCHLCCWKYVWNQSIYYHCKLSSSGSHFTLICTKPCSFALKCTSPHHFLGSSTPFTLIFFLLNALSQFCRYLLYQPVAASATELPVLRCLAEPGRLCFPPHEKAAEPGCVKLVGVVNRRAGHTAVWEWS